MGIDTTGLGWKVMEDHYMNEVKWLEEYLKKNLKIVIDTEDVDDYDDLGRVVTISIRLDGKIIDSDYFLI